MARWLWWRVVVRSFLGGGGCSQGQPSAVEIAGEVCSGGGGGERRTVSDIEGIQVV